MSNGPEFSWEYSYGRTQGNSYPQMGMNGSTPGGGRQWLHSNQANTANMSYMHNSEPNSWNSGKTGDPFAAYNQSIMNQYGNFKTTYGHSQMGPASVNSVINDSDQGMSQSMHADQSMNQYMGQGMGQGMTQSMGQGMRNGLGSMGGRQRLCGGSASRSNGLNEPAKAYRGSWF